MMTGIYYVTGVTSKTATRKDRTTYPVYDVFLSRRIGERWSEIVSTRDALQASLCERAHVTGRSVDVGARETRFGWEIVTVDLTPLEATA